MLKTLVSIISSTCRIHKQRSAAAKNMPAENLPDDLVSAGIYTLNQTAQCGEKYDINLELLSELCLLLSQSEVAASHSDELCKNSLALIDILKEKGCDALLKNIDVIKANLAL